MRTRFQSQRRMSDGNKEAKPSRVSKRLLGETAPDLNDVVPYSDAKRIRHGMKTVSSKVSKAQWFSKVKDIAIPKERNGESTISIDISDGVQSEETKETAIVVDLLPDRPKIESNDSTSDFDELSDSVEDKNRISKTRSKDFRLQIMVEKNRQLELQLKMEEQKTIQKQIQANVVIKKEEAAERKLNLQLQLEEKRKNSRERNTNLQERLVKEKGQQQRKLLEPRSRAKIKSYRDISEEKARLQEEQREKRLGLIRRSSGVPHSPSPSGHMVAQQMINAFRQIIVPQASPAVLPKASENDRTNKNDKKKAKKKKGRNFKKQKNWLETFIKIV